MNKSEYPAPEKTTQSTTDEAFERIREESSGEITYGFTNDYMFRAIFQKNPKALKGLLRAIFGLKQEEILSCEVTNPIVLGEHADNKSCILDIRVCLNGDRKIDLEMQMGNLYNWPKRSVYYLCAMYTDLKKGQDYNNALPCVHVGFVSASPFPDYDEFVSEYFLMNPKNHHVYSRDISLIMVNLSKADIKSLADTEDKEYIENETDKQELYQWAKLFNARDWKEVVDLAENSEDMKEAVVTLRELSEDEKIKLECLGRIMYNGDMSSAREQGIQIGTQRGIQIGTQQGARQGNEQRQIKTVQRMLKAKKYNYEEIAEIAEMSVENVKRIAEDGNQINR